MRLGELPANDPDVAARRCRSSTRRSSRRRRAGPAGTATTATATATARATAIRGRRAARAPATSGRCSRPSAASRRSRRGDAAGGGLAARRAWSAFASGVGLIPEQDWELPDLAASPYGTDPTVASIGFPNGGAGRLGLAADVVGGVVRAARGRPRRRAERRAAGRSRTARYVAHAQGATTLTVTSPADGSSVAGSPVTVTGTTAPGNTVYVSATNTDANSATTHRLDDRRRRTARSASPSPVTGGTTVLNVVAVSPSGATAHAQRTRRLRLRARARCCSTSPTRTATTTAPATTPIRRRRLPRRARSTSSTSRSSTPARDVIFRVQTRDLTPTFGSPLGAQLVDVYVHVPGAATTSTAAANGTTVAQLHDRAGVRVEPADPGAGLRPALRRRERRDARHGRDHGERGLALHHVHASRRPRSGTPGPGWGFTVVLTGQDGFSADQARGFQSTPQDFQFGVCATASANPHCTVRPGHRPEGDRRDHAAGRRRSRPSSTTRSARSCCRASRSRSGDQTFGRSRRPKGRRGSSAPCG